MTGRVALAGRRWGGGGGEGLQKLGRGQGGYQHHLRDDHDETPSLEHPPYRQAPKGVHAHQQILTNYACLQTVCVDSMDHASKRYATGGRLLVHTWLAI